MFSLLTVKVSLTTTVALLLLERDPLEGELEKNHDQSEK